MLAAKGQLQAVRVNYGECHHEACCETTPDQRFSANDLCIEQSMASAVCII